MTGPDRRLEGSARLHSALGADMVDFCTDSAGRSPLRMALLVAVFVLGGEEVSLAQNEAPSRGSEQEARFCQEQSTDRGVELRGLVLLYCTTAPELSVPLRAGHATARPAFYGGVPAAWIGAGIARDPGVVSAAYRLTLSQGFAYGLVLGLKHAVARPRPYVHRSLHARAARHKGPSPDGATLSFPSGHASLSAALVTSWSLSFPRWYVIGPGTLWATSVALSRVHLGVHYPSDVLAGVLLGTGVALLVHQLRTALSPPSIQSTSEPGEAFTVPLTLRIQF